jgi:phosphatidate cytidylyltransferase
LSAWVALFELRVLGPLTLVSCLALVWCADTGAYLVGRWLGRHPLAPRISPGKTWEGALGGWAMAWLGVAVLGAGGYGLAGALLRSPAGPGGVAAVVTVLVALSIAGDLYESLLKRLAGVKDSGRLLPGHGGVLDRIDALLPSMPVCWLLLDYLLRS